MAVDMEKLVVQLSADIKKYENALNRAMGVTNRQAKAIESRFARMNKRVASSMSFSGSFGRGLLGGLAAGFSAQGVQQLLDSATKIQNALKSTGITGEELAKVYGQLFDAAQRNQAPIEGLVTLYSRVSLAQKELGVSSEQIVGLVDTVGKAIKLSGGDAAQASGALLQLSQALGGGKIQAEEYNSLIDGMPGLLQAAAAGITEAGGSVAKLTALVKGGDVSSKAFFDGIQAGASVLDERLAGAEQTVSGSFVRLQNVLTDVATKLGDSTDASRVLSDFLNGPLTGAIQEAGAVFNWLVDPISQFISYVDWASDAVLQLSADMGRLTGLDEVGRALGAKPFVSQGRIKDRIDGAFVGTAAPKSGRAGTELTVSKGTVVRPVTLADYPVTGGKSARGSRGSRERQDDLQREIEQIKERTAAIQAETAAMAGINPLIDDYGFALEKARSTQDLLNAAQKAGIAGASEFTDAQQLLNGNLEGMSPTARALAESIRGLATGYANASVAAEQLAESQDKARQSAEEMRDLGKDVMGGFIHDLLDGKSAADALAGALGKIGDKLLDMALDGLFDGFGKGGSGGGFKGIFGGAIIPGILHKGGIAGSSGYGHGRSFSPGVFAGAPRYHSGGIAGLKPGEVPAILQKGEVVLPRGMKSGGGGLTIDARTTIDARGADPAAIIRLEAAMRKRDAELPGRVVAAVRDAQRRNVSL
ncbi:hypothetical protein ASD64_14690 [Mesorhizobium sp. Root157]|uniref:tape measure protein n=1 Tax=Mesorhizobium sp. Root157 TaxID=1736477 RepID=UPI0006F730B9|nr:tape measure protein [Mesorhizobium sp. Root157]KQZ99576.1 hypothetical protein ASD64_14690 [Mesorhizobium sp. Root157]